MKFTLATCVGALAAWTASAYTPANDALPPSGNAVLKPGLNEQVTAGQPYNIIWEPTQGDYITLLLLRGPADLMVTLLTVAENIPNSGSYSWDVPGELEGDVAGYGIKLIVEGTGQYQYSTQFGVSSDYEVGSDDGTDTDTDTEAPPPEVPAYNTSTYVDNSGQTVTVLPATTEEVYPAAATTTAVAATEEEVYPSHTAVPTAPSAGSVYYPSMSASNETGYANATGTVPIVMATGAAAPLRRIFDGAAVVVVAGLAGALAL